jgi:hypothetical protein
VIGYRPGENKEKVMSESVFNFDMDKPHKGKITDWFNNQSVIMGLFIDHPEYHGMMGHTSQLLYQNFETGEIETMNSRYTLVGDSIINDKKDDG